MENYQNSMAFFQNAYRICFVIAVVAFIIALLMFFFFDIRTIFMIKTGRARQRTVDEMSAKNALTGKLRDDSGRATGARTKSANTQKMKEETLLEAENLSAGPPPAAQPSPAVQASAPVPQSKQSSLGGQTVLLSDTMAPRAEAQKPVSDGSFVIVQRTIVTHTEERIAV